MCLLCIMYIYVFSIPLQSATETVLAAEFHPMDRYTLITVGRNHIHFWDTEGGTLVKKLGLFEVCFYKNAPTMITD